MSAQLRHLVPLFLICVAASTRLSSQTIHADSQLVTASSARGWLLLEGGGRLGGSDIVTRFVALAGGPGRNIVVIPTAIADSQFTTERLARCETQSERIFAVARVTCLDARDRAEANSERFIEALRRADAVWIYGGDEERLVDRYVGTKVVAALQAVLDRDGVLGGTSAGAMILASYIPTRDTLPVSAFGFLRNAAVVPHYAQRHYEREMRLILARHPSLTGFGIDEGTAIVVHGAQFDVIGEGGVTVMKEHTVVLHRGERFDLTTSALVGVPRGE
jgi:cyanophycinase